MKFLQNFCLLAIILCLAIMLPSCKKKAEEPDLYAFLKGTWQYENGAECTFDAATKTAKGTKVPTDNKFKFVVGEDYWKEVVSIGTNKWEFQQIIRYTDGTRTYMKSTATKQDNNTLATDIPSLGKGVLKRVQ